MPRARISFVGFRAAGETHRGVWIETDLKDARWRAAFRLLPEASGLPIVAEIRILPADNYPGRMPGEWSATRSRPASVPEGGISARLLRTVQLGNNQREFVEAMRRALPKAFARRGFAVGEEPPAKDGGNRRNDLFYARLARDYATLYAKGHTRPVVELARRRDLRPARVRDLVHEARRRGFLSPAHAGKAGGALTPRGAALLETKPRPKRRAKGGRK